MMDAQIQGGLNSAVNSLRNNDPLEAKEIIQSVLSLDGSNLMAKELLAYAEAHLGNLDRAMVLLDDVTRHPDATVSALYEYGALLLAKSSPEQAIPLFERARIISPLVFEIEHDLGSAYALIGQKESSLRAFKNALEINPQSPELLYNLGRLHDDLYQEKEANFFYEKALELDLDFSPAWINLGLNMNYVGRYKEGLKCLERAKEIEAGIDFIAGDIAHAEMHLGIWKNFKNNVKNISQAVLDKQKSTHPFHLLGLVDDPQIQRKAAEIYTNTKYSKGEVQVAPKKNRKQKIKVAYISADFWNHATTHLTAELFELHNKEEFEIYAFSFGHGRDDEYRKRLMRAFDKFIDITNLSDKEVLSLASEIDTDIAVDLSGHTQDARTNLFAQRLAPIQINYLVYPGTMGSKYHDYLLADRTLIPEGADLYYSEKIIYLPNSYQINDRKKLIAEKEFKRSDFGLPENGFIFCCFNNGFKITPKVFEIWMKILSATDKSVLWLLAKNIQFVENIKQQARDRGIDDGRIIFADPINMPDHLARQRLADLFLDTFPYGAHTTASDALWVGLPVITRVGCSFASRVGASLLNAIGLPELVTQTEQEYLNLAVELAKNPLKMKKIRERLSLNRNTEPLFNTPLNVTHIESAFREAYSRYQLGLLPEHIFIDN
jgi:predicted O-linked N-acetylglucosamine transferase (SPINDLY family)